MNATVMCHERNFGRGDRRGAIKENRQFRQHFGIIVAGMTNSSVESKRRREGGVNHQNKRIKWVGSRKMSG